MCRLFGFRSVIASQVHSSLMEAENALGTQSNSHPDGWGVAYYVDGCPQVTRSPAHALGDQLFHRLSGVVASQTVLAHVRKATQGDKTVLNCHPFQYGRWVFAHNGDVPDFATTRDELRSRVSSRLRRFILGDTDSETIFFLFLTELEKLSPLGQAGSVRDVAMALRRAIHVVQTVSQASEKPLLLTMVVTDGNVLAGVQGGKELYLSTYKHRCKERDTCSSLSPECEAESKTGFVNHFILSSEPLSGQNVWAKLEPGSIAAVDGSMRVLHTHLDHISLPVI
jgi:predicted glutamine amidotransferase